jgi:hypothetical protein
MSKCSTLRPGKMEEHFRLCMGEQVEHVVILHFLQSQRDIITVKHNYVSTLDSLMQHVSG